MSPVGLTKPVSPVQATATVTSEGQFAHFNPKRSNTKIAEVVASPPSDCRTLLSERLERATEVDDNYPKGHWSPAVFRVCSLGSNYQPRQKRNAKIKTNGAIQPICPIFLIFHEM